MGWVRQVSAAQCLTCIALLQETHCTKKEEKLWEKNWDGKIFFSKGSSNSKGVAILIPSNINFELCENSDNEGRMLIVKLKIQSDTYVLCNIYHPTQDHKLEQNYLSFPNKNIHFFMTLIFIGTQN